MTRRCVAASCISALASSSALVFGFPSNPVVRRKWVPFVRARRADVNDPLWNGGLCREHFAPDELGNEFALMKGHAERLRLKSGAELTIQQLHDASQPPTKRCKCEVEL